MLRKAVVIGLLAMLAACSSEPTVSYKMPNWQRDVVVAAPAAKPVATQEDVDEKGRKEWRFLYMPKDKPGFQVELDGDDRIDRIVIMFDQFTEGATHQQDNAAVLAMAKKTLAVLTGGDGRELESLMAAAGGDGLPDSKRRVINGVEIVPDAISPMFILTLQRPVNAL